MIEASDVLFFWTETPLHAGSGATTGYIDLPIQRDRQTGHPLVQASGVKGVLREHCHHGWGRRQDMTDAVFGPDDSAGGSSPGDFGGAASVSDARLLLLPVRSLRGICAWVTCPLALAWLGRDLARCGRTDGPPPLSAAPPEGTAWTSPKCPLVREDLLVLEEYALTAFENNVVADIAKWLRDEALPADPAYAFWRRKLLDEKNVASQLVLLSDDDFQAFAETATDVVQRISVNSDTGTVRNTGLWTEENLPADSLLYNVLHASAPRGALAKSPVQVPDDLLETENGIPRPSARRVLACIGTVLAGRPLLQMGGNETVGRGLTRVRRLNQRAIKSSNQYLQGGQSQ